MDTIYQKLKSKLPALEKDLILAPLTSFKIGGSAKYFFIAKNNKEIIKSTQSAKDLGIDFFILGGGSNILISDKGFDGLVIKMQNTHLSSAKQIVTAESGVPLQKLIQFSIRKNLSGLEHLIGIPGTVGGGVVGNVGTPEKWINENLIEVAFLNACNVVEVVPKSQCDFSYRFSRFKYDSQDIVLSASWKLSPSSPNKIKDGIKAYLSKRGHQPVNQPSAGSIFKNPPGQKAWQLIEKIGLRGKQIGGAKISDDHCNFIVNTGNAKAEDVIILISFIKQQVRDTLGFQLQEEIKYIGF